MSGSAARRYGVTEDTEAHLRTYSASTMMQSLMAGARGVQGQPHEPVIMRERRPANDGVDFDYFIPEAESLPGPGDYRDPEYVPQNARRTEGNVVQFPQKRQSLDESNTAHEMDAQMLTELGMKIRRTYEIDDASRQKWLTGYRKALELVDYQTKAKSYPIENAANIKYPLLIMSSLQFAARAYPAIIRSGDMVKTKIEGYEPSVDQIQVTEDELKTPEGQRRYQLELLKSQKTERGIRVSSYMSWQLRSQMTNWEDETDQLLHQIPLVGCMFRKVYDDATTGQKRSLLCSAEDVVINMKARSLQDAPRISQRFELYPYQLQEAIIAGFFRDIRSEIHLDSDSMEDDQAPIEFIEQHCRYDLDGDGYSEPYIITIHKDTGVIARIEKNWDKHDVRLTRDGRIKSIRPTQIFVKYDFFPNPLGGIYGVGFGHILRDITDGINTTLNQILDAGHLQNSAGGFIGKGLKFGRSETGERLHVAQNRYHYVNSTGSDLRTQIVNFDHKGPSPVLFQVLGMLIEAGKEIASVKDVLTGDTGGQSANMPVGTVLALIEQGLQVFTAIYKRIYRSLSQEFQILFALNGKRLNAEEYMIVTDDPRAQQDDFARGSHDITPVADPTVVTDMQRIGRAQFLTQYLEDPMLNRREIYNRIFDAAKIDNVEALFATPDQKAEQMEILQMKLLEAELADKDASATLKRAQSVERLSEAAVHKADAGLAQADIILKGEDLRQREQEGQRRDALEREKLRAQPPKSASATT